MEPFFAVVALHHQSSRVWPVTYAEGAGVDDVTRVRLLLLLLLLMLPLPHWRSPVARQVPQKRRSLQLCLRLWGVCHVCITGSVKLWGSGGQCTRSCATAYRISSWRRIFPELEDLFDGVAQLIATFLSVRNFQVGGPREFFLASKLVCEEPVQMSFGQLPVLLQDASGKEAGTNKAVFRHSLSFPRVFLLVSYSLCLLTRGTDVQLRPGARPD